MIANLYEYQQISHLDKEEQRSLIQCAKYEAYTTLGLAGRGIVYFLLSLLSSAALLLILPRFISSTLASLIGISSFLICYQVSAKSLISQGLQSILEKQRINQDSLEIT